MSALLQNIPKLRPMYGIDIDVIVDIEKSIYPYPWTRGNFTDSISAGYNCWVTECGGVIAAYGVLMLGAKESHILNLSVAAPWQRNGLGSHLLQNFIEISREKVAKTMFLEVRPSNTAARALYKSAGFTELTARRNYYPAAGGKEDAIIMSLAI